MGAIRVGEIEELLADVLPDVSVRDSKGDFHEGHPLSVGSVALKRVAPDLSDEVRDSVAVEEGDIVVGGGCLSLILEGEPELSVVAVQLGARRATARGES